MKCKMLIQN